MANAFDEIAANKFKSYVLVFFFSVIIIGLGYIFGKIYGGGSNTFVLTFMIIAFIISIIMALYGYYHGDQTALNISKAYLATKQNSGHLINSVEGLSIAAGIPVPKIYVIPDQNINAFATGRDPEHASLAVTEGALTKLNRTELEGVVAHELGHVKNYDVRLMTLVVILVGMIALMSDFFLRSMFWGRGDEKKKEEE